MANLTFYMAKTQNSKIKETIEKVIKFKMVVPPPHLVKGE